MTEDQLQADCLAWFRSAYPAESGMMFAVPNGGQRNKLQAAQMVATGVTAGVPDLVWVTLSGAVVMIEMKTAKGTLSPVQKTWHRKAGERLANRLFVVRSVAEFKELIPAVYALGRCGLRDSGLTEACDTVQKYTTKRIKEVG
jgi:hypothetical protein